MDEQNSFATFSLPQCAFFRKSAHLPPIRLLSKENILLRQILLDSLAAENYLSSIYYHDKIGLSCSHAQGCSQTNPGFPAKE